MREQEEKRANTARAAATADVAKEVMNAYNRTKKNPGDMACLGHDTARGFEFALERDGVVYTFTVSRDLATL